MRFRKAALFTIAGITLFFVSGFVVGYVTWRVSTYLGLSSESGFDAAILSAISAVIGYVYRSFVVKLFKKAAKAIVSK